MPAGERGEGCRELVAGEPEALALDLQPHEEGSGVAHVLVGGEDVPIVHRDERGDRRDEALPVRAGDEQAQVVAHERRTLRIVEGTNVPHSPTPQRRPARGSATPPTPET